MKLEKAEKYLKILKNYKGKIKSDKGLVVWKFDILPIKYLNQKNIVIDLNELVEGKSQYQLFRNKELDYRIIGIHRLQSSTYSISKNSEYYEKMIENKEIE
jgi:hypothetical protein